MSTGMAALKPRVFIPVEAAGDDFCSLSVGSVSYVITILRPVNTFCSMFPLVVFELSSGAGKTPSHLLDGAGSLMSSLGVYIERICIISLSL
jgi:hypothetical protein